MSSAVGGAPPSHHPSDSLNGRNPTIPAIPAVNGNSIDHSRKPSMTVTPAGTTGFTPNGGALGGRQNKPDVQFGSVNASAASPALGTTPPTLAHQNSSSLGVNQINHRVNSPIPSPSPIPQPANPSGGRPPSTFGSQGNGLVFGQQGGEQGDPSVGSLLITLDRHIDNKQGLARPMSQLQYGGSDHMRRNSSQSMHSEMSNSGLPTGPQSRPYGMQGGRGRGGYQSFQGQPYGSPYNSRGAPNNRGNPHFNPSRGQHNQYTGSPHMTTRTPTLVNSTPGGTPFMPPNQMMQPMQGPNGVPFYPVNNFPPQIPFPPEEPIRGKPGKRKTGAVRGSRGRGTGRGGHENGAPRLSRDPALGHYPPPLPPMQSIPFAPGAPGPICPLPDLSLASGYFEHFLTQAKGTAADPSIQQYYNQNMQNLHGMGYQQGMNQYPGYPPQSPRPPFQQGYQPMQQNYGNQPQPQSMSRQSSAMSIPERPTSTIEHPQTPSIPNQAPHTSSRTPSMSTNKSNFTIPPKKRNAIQIKNPAGEIVEFKPSKTPASPATVQPPSASVTPSIPTPPQPEVAAPEPAQPQADASAKSAEEKRRAMQEAVKARIAQETKPDKVEDKAHEKAEIEAEEAEAAKVEAEEAKETAEALEKEAAEAEQKVEAAKPAQPEEEDEPTLPAPSEEPKPAADDDEIDFDALEAEMAAAEAEAVSIHI